MSEPRDLINSAINKNPIQFEEDFKNIVQERCVERINEKRIEVAQAIYGGTAEVNEETETDEDFDDIDIDIDDLNEEDYEFSDEDFDDLDEDFDDEDFDLDLNEEDSDEEDIT